MPTWFSLINYYQEKESEMNSSRLLQMSTVAPYNTPRVRTVVFRAWTDSFEMIIFTDKRSQKFGELEVNNNVEICWLFPKAKCQFRFRGNSKIDSGKDSSYFWSQLDHHTKSMLSWPKPCDKYALDKSEQVFSKKVSNHSHNFALLKIEVNHVDQLLLHKPIHIRRQWKKNEEWIEERINP